MDKIIKKRNNLGPFKLFNFNIYIKFFESKHSLTLNYQR